MRTDAYGCVHKRNKYDSHSLFLVLGSQSEDSGER